MVGKCAVHSESIPKNVLNTLYNLHAHKSSGDDLANTLKAFIASRPDTFAAAVAANTSFSAIIDGGGQRHGNIGHCSGVLLSSNCVNLRKNISFLFIRSSFYTNFHLRSYIILDWEKQWLKFAWKLCVHMTQILPFNFKGTFGLLGQCLGDTYPKDNSASLRTSEECFHLFSLELSSVFSLITRAALAALPDIACGLRPTKCPVKRCPHRCSWFKPTQKICWTLKTNYC